MKTVEYDLGLNKPKTVIINGANSQINLDSEGNFIVNNTTINLDNISFEEIKNKLLEIEDENIKKESLECLNDLEQSKDLNSYAMNLIKLFSILADVITIMGPFIPKLTSIFGF